MGTRNAPVYFVAAERPIANPANRYDLLDEVSYDWIMK